MSPIAKRQLRAALYRDLADGAAVLAGTTPLANVREKHERAAARWVQLAEADERDAEARQGRR